MAVHLGVLTITLAFDESFSLKDKRQVLRSLLDRARRDIHASIAETNYQNRIRSAEVSLAFIGTSKQTIEAARFRAESLFDSEPSARVESFAWEWR